MFVMAMVSPIMIKIIIMMGKSLLQIFDIVLIPFMMIIPARMVTISDTMILSILYIFVVRVVMVLFWIEVKRKI